MTGAGVGFWNRERLFRIAALLVIVMVASVLRLWRLESLPPGLYHDEAYNGLDALSLVQGKTFPQFYEGWELYAADAHEERPAQESRWPLFFEGNYGREPLHVYLMAISIRLLGANVKAIRLVPALAGVLSVLTTYLAANELLAWKVKSRSKGEGDSLAQRVLLDPALIGALAMAMLFPAVHFSRFGIRAMLFVPLATLTVTLFWRGINQSAAIERGEPARLPVAANFVGAGLVLGLSLYTYAAARLFPVVFICFALYWFWRDRSALQRHWRQMLVMAGVSVLTAFPLLLFFARYPYYFVFRIAFVANKGRGAVEGRPWLTWLNNVGRVARGLFLSGEQHLRHNLPGRPYMDPIQGALFLAGAAVTVIQRLQLRQVFLWLWLAVMLLPSILSGDAPHFGRLAGAAPVIAIFIGIGWSGVVDYLMDRTSQRGNSLVVTVGSALLLASLLWTSIDYFSRYARHPELPAAFYQDDWELGSVLAEYPADTTLYLTPAQEELATIYYALGTPERLTNFTGSDGLLPAGFPGQPSLYVIRPSDADYLETLRARFPEGELGEKGDGFLTFYVPAGDNNDPLGNSIPLENEMSFSWEDQIKLIGWSQDWREDEVAVTLAWQGGPGLEQDYTVFVHLLDESGEIASQVDRPPAGYPTGQWREGEAVIDTFVLQLPPGLSGDVVTLQSGFYEPSTSTNLGDAAVLGRIVIGNSES